MDWLRRNWPDLLIGVALVAVIAGIIATLISGGSFFPVGQGSKTAGGTGTSQSAAVTPGAVAVPSVVQPNANAGVQAPADAGGAPLDETSGGASVEAPAAAADGQAAPAQAGGAISVLPPSGVPTNTAGSTSGAPAAPEAPAATAPAATQPAAGPVVAPPPPAAAAPATAPAAATPPATAPSGAQATAAADQSSYRVSVGAFGNAENAQRLASTFQSAGYPVLLGTQGNLTIVLVGPYETEAQARSVASAIGAGNFGVVDPTVYRYDPDGSGAGASGPATTPAAAPAASTPAPAAAAAAPAGQAPSASPSGRYLQVGAYATSESAAPQHARLRDLGFTATERTEGALIKLLVGPYEGAALTDAQAKLAAGGIESFPR